MIECSPMGSMFVFEALSDVDDHLNRLVSAMV